MLYSFILIKDEYSHTCCALVHFYRRQPLQNYPPKDQAAEEEEATGEENGGMDLAGRNKILGGQVKGAKGTREAAPIIFFGGAQGLFGGARLEPPCRAETDWTGPVLWGWGCGEAWDFQAGRHSTSAPHVPGECEHRA